MTNPETYIAISSLISILGIFYIFMWRYRPLIMDSFRQDIFGLRDELFDFAADGNIEFGHRAYGLLRTTMNGYIRFAHDFSIWQATIATAITSREDREYLRGRGARALWIEATKDLDVDVKEKLDFYRDRMEFLAVSYFFLASPHSILLIIPFVAFMTLRHPDEAKRVSEEASQKVLRRKKYQNRKVRLTFRATNDRPERLRQVFSEAAQLYGEHGHVAP